MRIALTGGTGFIGQCLLRLSCKQHEFVVYTPHANAEGLFRGEGIVYVPVDRLGHSCAEESPEALYPGIESCDAAINLGFARPRPGAAQKFADYLSSIVATDAFIGACLEAEITNIVHISTRSVYSPNRPLPHTEEEPAEPFSPYGAAKAAAEAIALAYNQSSGAHAKILRLAQIIGKNEYQGVVSTSLRAIQSQKALQIWGSGTETAREYLYVRDACEAILCALDHPQSAGVYNIGTGTMLTVEELITTIAEVFADDGAHVERHPEKTVQPARFCMDVTKAREELGWQARFTFRQALEAMRADVASLY